MNNLDINKYYLIYTIILSIFVIFFLTIKHNVGNDSSISEWLINYQGGFTRRGLGGELAIFVSKNFNFELRVSILILQIFFHISYLILLFFLIKNMRFNYIQIFSIFTPIFLIYPLAEIEVLGRKEIILFLVFLISIFLSNPKLQSKYLNLFCLISLPVLCLLWEQVILFFPYFAVLIIFKNNPKELKKIFSLFCLIFGPSIVVFCIIWFNPLSIDGKDIMCKFLENNFSERCYMSADLLIKNTIYFSTIEVVHSNANFSHYLRYILIFLIGFLPLNVLILKNKFLFKKNFLSKNFDLYFIFFALYSPAILLFIFGYDWGRWVNITYTFSILLYLFLLKNAHITNNISINKKTIQILKKRKIFLLFAFIIFAFGWSPKTAITGDISSFPGYRIPLKFFKLIN